VRYRYLAYKYTRQRLPDTVYQSVWESFGAWPLHTTSLWRPPTDIYETSDEILVVIELAGMTEDDMNVTLFSDLLVVEGVRHQPDLADMNACHQLGIKYGDFRAEIALHAAVDHKRVTADYKNGLLKITLHKLE
jgi:HSP20 family protein